MEAGDAFSVEWDYSTDSEVIGTTGDLNPFDIELRSCGQGGEGCENLSCGTTYRTLCERGNGVCMDSDGSYDVVIPDDVPAGDYVISVTYMGAAGWAAVSSMLSSSSSSSLGGVTACSKSFAVAGATSTVEEGTPVLEATTPTSELSPGQAFTAQWVYDNGDGQGGGNFEVNLYSCADGACSDGR